jgi:5-methylcytosine-specific restriction endonuclease McrA
MTGRWIRPGTPPSHQHCFCKPVQMILSGARKSADQCCRCALRTDFWRVLFSGRGLIRCPTRISYPELGRLNRTQLRELFLKRHRHKKSRFDREERSRRMLAAREKGRHSKAEWEQLLRESGYRCSDCKSKKPLQRDHIRPISRGGSDAIENIQALCASCNQKKWAF